MPALLIDASSPTLFFGAFENGKWLELLSKEVGAMEGLFDLTAELFKKIPLKSCGKIVFCEGPGRLMSLRIAAVAANQWKGESKRGLAYNSLELSSMVAGEMVGVELRKGAIALWKNNKIEVAPVLPPGAELLTPKLYSKAVNEFPALVEKLSRAADFFDPPLWAPIEYKKV